MGALSVFRVPPRGVAIRARRRFSSRLSAAQIGKCAPYIKYNIGNNIIKTDMCRLAQGAVTAGHKLPFICFFAIFSSNKGSNSNEKEYTVQPA